MAEHAGLEQGGQSASSGTKKQGVATNIHWIGNVFTTVAGSCDRSGISPRGGSSLADSPVPGGAGAASGGGGAGTGNEFCSNKFDDGTALAPHPGGTPYTDFGY